MVFPSMKIRRILCGCAAAACALLATTPLAAQSGGNDLLLDPPTTPVEVMEPDKSVGLFEENSRGAELLDPRNSFGATPTVTEDAQRKFGSVVQKTIDVENTMDLVMDRPRLLLFKRAPVRVQIPSEEIARYTIISERELSVTGLKPGTTVLNIWFENESNAYEHEVLSYLLRVIPDPEERSRLEGVYKALENEINAAFPESLIQLSLVGNNLLVQGQAKDIVDAAQILMILEQEAPGAPEDVPTPMPNVSFNFNDPTEADIPSIRSYVLGGHRNIVNRLRIPGEQQIMLKVTVAEVTRNAARSLGFSFNFIDDGPDIGRFSNTTAGSPTGASSNLIFSYFGDHTFQAALKALRNNNLARTLAEPSLVTLNGKPAQFRTGGSFPIPTVTGATSDGLQGVSFEEFGVDLSFTPFITDRDNIRLVIDTNVSSRNDAGGSTVGSTEVPALDERTFNTTVELREGQTLAIAGILQTQYSASSSKIPFFGDLPIIGPLLGGQESASTEQELVVLVTPQIIRPLEERELVAAGLPGADVFEPDDLEFYLLGRMESRAPRDFRAAAQTDFDRLRHRRLNQVFIKGPVGYAKVREDRY